MNSTNQSGVPELYLISGMQIGKGASVSNLNIDATGTSTHPNWKIDAIKR